MTLFTTRRRSFVRSLVALAATIALVGSSATMANATELEAPAASLSGTVTDAATGAGVEDASVVVLDSAGAEAGSAVTGSTGGYTVSGLEPGDYRVSVSAASSYEPLFYPTAAAFGDAGVVTLSPGEARVGVDVGLAPVLGEESLAAGAEPVAEPGSSEGFESASEAGLPLGEEGSAHPQPAEDAGDVPAETAAPAAQSFAVPTADGTGTISGVVMRASDGTPVSGWLVEAFGEFGGIWSAGAAETAADGSYSISGLAPGRYLIAFSGSEDWRHISDLAPEFWPGGTAFSRDAAWVDVAADETVTGIDANLEPGGTITGTVTLADGGAPAAGVEVHLAYLWSEDDFLLGSQTYTNADGSYALTGVPPGEHRVHFETDWESGLLSEYWESTYSYWGSYWSANLVGVVAGVTTPGIDASLEVSGSISGTVTRASDGSPVSGLDVSVWGEETGVHAYGSTRADGSYTIDRLPPDSYRVFFSPDGGSGLASEYWEGAGDYDSATIVDVSPGEAVTLIDASLRTTGSIAGIVTREDDGEPVAGVFVTAAGPGYGYAETASDGSYTITGLAPGEYDVRFEPNDIALVAEYWNGTYDWADATPVAVRSGETTSSIDASLRSGGTISGQVRFEGGSFAAMGVIVTVANADNGVVVATRLVEQWTEDSRYSINGLPEGNYLVEVNPYSMNGWASQYYSGAATVADATSVIVRAGAEVIDIDFDIVAGVNITGTVAPVIEDRRVEAVAYRWSDDTWHEVRRVSARGEYSFAPIVHFGTPSVSGDTRAPHLPAGTYTVGFEADGYCPQFWNGASSLDAATSFTPEVGTTQTGIDAVLSTECDTPSVVPGSPIVTGTAQVGQTLTAVPGDWSPEPVEKTYQWLANGTPIAGATGTTLELGAAQEGATITVQVTGARPGHTSASATSPQVGPVTAATLPEVTPGTPTIAGIPTAGEVLTAVPGAWVPDDVTLSYQWWAGSAPIVGATGATFVPGEAEVGAVLAVEVTGSKSGYAPATAPSGPFGPIQAAALLDLDPGTPTVTGVPKVGEPLTALPGVWGPAPVTLAYQWLVDGEPVEGASATTFTPAAEHAGKTVSVTVQGTKAGFNPASETSAPVGPVAAGTLTTTTPVVSGTPRVGEPLTATTEPWGPAPVELSYQWLVDGEPIDGATATSFAPDAAQLGGSVAVTVTGVKAGYETASETSEPTAPVAEGVLSVSDPVVSGEPRVGRELRVDVSAWGPLPLDLEYQWLADGEPIDGATADRFTPDAALVGVELSVRVSATKPGYAPAERIVVIGEVPPSIAVSTPRAQRGEEIVVTGEYYIPGEEVLLELHSSPIVLTTVTADEEGEFRATVTVPAEAELGAHHVVGTGQTSGLVASAPLVIYDPAVAPPTGGGSDGGGSDGTAGTGSGGAGGNLSSSGGELPTFALMIGVLLLATGGLLVWRRRAIG